MHTIQNRHTLQTVAFFQFACTFDSCYLTFTCLLSYIMWCCYNSYCPPCFISQARSSSFNRTVPVAHGAWGSQLTDNFAISTDFKKSFKADSAVNFKQNISKRSHHSSITLLHYLVIYR